MKKQAAKLLRKLSELAQALPDALYGCAEALDPEEYEGVEAFEIHNAFLFTYPLNTTAAGWIRDRLEIDDAGGILDLDDNEFYDKLKQRYPDGLNTEEKL